MQMTASAVAVVVPWIGYNGYSCIVYSHCTFGLVLLHIMTTGSLYVSWCKMLSFLLTWAYRHKSVH